MEVIKRLIWTKLLKGIFLQKIAVNLMDKKHREILAKEKR